MSEKKQIIRHTTIDSVLALFLMVIANITRKIADGCIFFLAVDLLFT